ncbi:hypothetical protein FB45DRAFT_1009222 [Roridomyces roridus]|uniref:Uncharacterized protein n=1 Tax=Roridomyces roridus TaxID=1738132 RepID=A0AAD7B7J1_9AGAR|nr:hypothetical protein FB45DRAFT_1009222 [Roridomyces roridus]
MHRALQIPEIVDRICTQLDTRTWHPFRITLEVTKARLGDLVVLARTSKAVFFPNALRIIWDSVTLLNLLRCLPSDAYKLESTGELFFIKYRMILLRPLKELDLERVRFYAPCIQHLFSDSNYADPASVLPAASSWLSPTIFPILQGLYWEHKASDFGFIHHFLGPQLTTIRVPCATPAAAELMSGLALRCPQLNDINCRILDAGSAKMMSSAASAVSQCVRGLNGLKRLLTDILDHAALIHISRLHSLRDLRLGAFPSGFNVPSDQPFFPSLQTLHFTSDPDSMQDFLKLGRGIPLVEFTGETRDFSTPSQVESVLSAAARGISYTTLKEFNFSEGYTVIDVSDAPDYLVPPSSLRPLFSFVNLTSVIILSGVGVDLDDAIVTDMARSWRHIEKLNIESFYGTAAPRTTLRCLDSFAQYCPKLNKLGIVFNATVVPTSNSSFSLPSLETLDVEASPISNPRPVALYLARIFPGLKTIETLIDSLDGNIEWEATVLPEASEYDERWKKVDSMMKRSAKGGAR